VTKDPQWTRSDFGGTEEVIQNHLAGTVLGQTYTDLKDLPSVILTDLKASPVRSLWKLPNTEPLQCKDHLEDLIPIAQQDGSAAKEVNDITIELFTHADYPLIEACVSPVKKLLKGIAQVAEQTGGMINKGVIDTIFKLTDAVLGEATQAQCKRQCVQAFFGMAKVAEQSGGSITRGAIEALSELTLSTPHLACAWQVAHLAAVFSGVSDTHSFNAEDLSKMKEADERWQAERKMNLKYLHAFGSIESELRITFAAMRQGSGVTTHYNEATQEQISAIKQVFATPSSQPMVQEGSLKKMQNAVHFLQYVKQKCYCRLSLVKQVAKFCQP